MVAPVPTPLSKIPGFNPRNTPVLGVDHHLDPIPQEKILSAALRQRFLSPPVWRPEITIERKIIGKKLVNAAVLIGIVERHQPSILLTLRTEHLSSHSGQIAFPGGKINANDKDPIEAAIRESEEEVGLSSRYIEVLGALPTYTTGTAFVVTPVVALIKPDFQMRINTNEVADVFEVPLSFLMTPANHQRHALNWEGVERKWFSMPYQDGNSERFIWGATAAMLRNFYRFLSA
ncbi:MAG: CoA pyrophosphatase [Limnohabitans sp.]|nr:CoA pyrophosphatase [Limnohabitans sp.]